MRVIAGTAKRRGLIVPRGLAVRPTADRVKEALFSILGALVPGCSFLDLFAGAGTVGIEALSRGAGRVVFVEKDVNNRRVIEKNLQSTDLAENARRLGLPVEKALPLLAAELTSFDLVFMDPPYEQGLIPATLAGLCRYDLLKPRGVAIAESGKKTFTPENVAGRLWRYRQEVYSETMLTFYQYK